MKSTLRKLGIKEKSPHSCRHTFSRLFESYGVREADVGHSFGNDITNGVYGYRTLEALRTTIKKIKVPGTSLGRGAGILVVEVRIPAFCFLQDCDTSDSVVKFSRKVSQPEEGKNHSSAKLAVILSDCTEIATGDAASLRYGI